MQVDLSDKSKDLLQSKLASGSSPEQIIEEALSFYNAYGPNIDSLNEKLREAHRSFEAGEVEPLDAQDIKRRGRLRQSS